MFTCHLELHAFCCWQACALPSVYYCACVCNNVCMCFPMNLFPILVCVYVYLLAVRVTLGYYESCPCSRAMEDSVPTCFKREVLKSTYIHGSTHSFLCLSARSCCQGDRAWTGHIQYIPGRIQGWE